MRKMLQGGGSKDGYIKEFKLKKNDMFLIGIALLYILFSTERQEIYFFNKITVYLF